MKDNGRVVEILEEIQIMALKNNELKSRFLMVREMEYPLREFCSICREIGYDIYPMDIIAASEEFYAEKKRSTNGGGENSPVLEGEDDLYEDFYAPLMR